MAKQTTNTPISLSKKRKGIHAKTQVSVHKNSKNYKKSYKGQGR